MMRGEAGLRSDLETLAIPFVEQEHKPLFTVADSEELYGVMAGAHTKNLFLKDAGGAFWLVTVGSDARVDLKALPAAIGSKRVSFGKAEDMERLLGIVPGSVTPMAAINASPGSITIVLDAPLAPAEQVNVHPLRNTATLGLSGAAILDLLRHWGHSPLVASIPMQESQ
ncbi:Ala-tRNA(Pro) deacylase [Sphingopyxis panaciterrae]|uniref:prolyl-tRNA synthetase associated domain-containing protein n=1 Tax=Sphingopyxis panaciterrae TaxID=363841 RepID=UPI001FBA5039|nr:prolyl-tRNA synthetase associated domain-containing protein [Sphingopyxis panaciterrae]NIJ38574.1 Ala-tRNA(Pro) deacylase [Sphingopyxis panaciterrae]